MTDEYSIVSRKVVGKSPWCRGYRLDGVWWFGWWKHIGLTVNVNLRCIILIWWLPRVENFIRYSFVVLGISRLYLMLFCQVCMVLFRVPWFSHPVAILCGYCTLSSYGLVGIVTVTRSRDIIALAMSMPTWSHGWFNAQRSPVLVQWQSKLKKRLVPSRSEYHFDFTDQEVKYTENFGDWRCTWLGDQYSVFGRNGNG